MYLKFRNPIFKMGVTLLALLVAVSQVNFVGFKDTSENTYHIGCYLGGSHWKVNKGQIKRRTR